jgi:hypothetical protein
VVAASCTPYHRQVPDVPEPLPRDASNASGDQVPPMLPSRQAFLLSFAGVVVAGLLGGVIGWGIADIMFVSSAAALAGALIGAVTAGGGVGIVAVLVLRAMAEWKRIPPDRREQPRPPRRS